MEPVSRDRMAGLKLLGGLLRLDALHPDGFTAMQLAEHTRVEPETARAYLNPAKGPGYAERIPGAKSTGADGPGRPAKLYHLRPNQRAEVIRRLAAVRRELDATASEPGPPAAQLFAPLDLLETTVEELERRRDPPDAWRDRLAEAQLECEGAVADLRALRARDSVDAVSFARQLQQLQDRLSAVKRAGQYDPIRRVVERFGEWLDGVAPAALEPVLVLLDGVQGDNPARTTLVNSCRAAAKHIAAFDVARMEEPHRAHLYATLDCLRVATPLAVCDFVLAVSGSNETARTLADEFRVLGQPGKWRACTPVVGDDFADLDLTALRRYYLAESKTFLDKSTDSAGAGFATCLVSALGALEAVEAAEGMPHLPFVNATEYGDRWRNGAERLMGNVVCIDVTRDAAEVLNGVDVTAYARPVSHAEPDDTCYFSAT